MADPRTKALDLVRKLLRTAATNSGASENERKTAAAHAVDLITKHDLAADLAKPEPEKPRKRRPRPPGAPTWTPPTYHPPPVYEQPHYYSPYTGTNWTEGAAPNNMTCAQCGGRIYAGEPIWYDNTHGAIHHNITCHEERRR